MRISAKCRYGIAALIKIAEKSTETAADSETLMSVLKLSEELGISKIYLEQVFGKLRHAGILKSVKGASGGYRLARAAEDITLSDIIFTLEDNIAGRADPTVKEQSPAIDNVIAEALVELDICIKKKLSETTLKTLSERAVEHSLGQAVMYYI
jgi:Rrf2 family protein